MLQVICTQKSWPCTFLILGMLSAFTNHWSKSESKQTAELDIESWVEGAQQRRKVCCYCKRILK